VDTGPIAVSGYGQVVYGVVRWAGWVVDTPMCVSGGCCRAGAKCQVSSGIVRVPEGSLGLADCVSDFEGLHRIWPGHRSATRDGVGSSPHGGPRMEFDASSFGIKPFVEGGRGDGGGGSQQRLRSSKVGWEGPPWKTPGSRRHHPRHTNSASSGLTTNTICGLTLAGQIRQEDIEPAVLCRLGKAATARNFPAAGVGFCRYFLGGWGEWVLRW